MHEIRLQIRFNSKIIHLDKIQDRMHGLRIANYGSNAEIHAQNISIWLKIKSAGLDPILFFDH